MFALLILSIASFLKAFARKITIDEEKASDKIEVLCGLEIGTKPKPCDFIASNSQYLDYCLFESIDSPKAMDLYEFLEWSRLFKCPKGLAHTDIFALCQRYETDIFAKLKEYDLFWEINVSGNYNYYYDFIDTDNNSSPKINIQTQNTQQAIRRSLKPLYIQPPPVFGRARCSR